MTAFCGMDTEHGRAHGLALLAAAQRVDELAAQLDAAVRAAPWDGPDADRFRLRVAELTSGPLPHGARELARRGDRLHGEADEQDIVSGPDGTGPDASVAPEALAPAPPGDLRRGYLHEDLPWLPTWIEDPFERTLSASAQTASDLLGRGLDATADVVDGWGEDLGWNVDGLDQLRHDAGSFGRSVTDLLTGERVPTVAELTAGALLMTASGGIAAYEVATGVDSPLLDDRSEVTVLDVRRTGATTAPHDLADLILDNDEARREMAGREGADAFDAGRATQIRIQEIASVHGERPRFIVQVPPTQGGVGNQDAWGAQGNPLGWDANPRLVAGQDTASMNAVRTAMREAGIPGGADVLFVGHSQGGIVAAHLAADADLNNTSGREGTYNITHSFSVGSPVQTVLPAQASTEVVSLVHGPLVLGAERSSGDPIPALDLAGLQVLGGHVSGPNLHEVTLPGAEDATASGASLPFVEDNHESVVRDAHGVPATDQGYYGSVLRAERTDPTLVGLTRELEGVYLGEGTAVTRETVVEVGRADLR